MIVIGKKLTGLCAGINIKKIKNQKVLIKICEPYMSPLDSLKESSQNSNHKHLLVVYNMEK